MAHEYMYVRLCYSSEVVSSEIVGEIEDRTNDKPDRCREREILERRLKDY